MSFRDMQEAMNFGNAGFGVYCIQRDPHGVVAAHLEASGVLAR
jgi:hypothetical protein